MSEPNTTAATAAPHQTFIEEAEAWLSRWLPFLVTGAEIGATATGAGAALDPIIAEAGGIAEAAVKVASTAPDNVSALAAVVGTVAQGVVDAKQQAAGAQPADGGGPGGGTPGGPH